LKLQWYVFDFLENFRGNVQQVIKLESGIWEVDSAHKNTAVLS